MNFKGGAKGIPMLLPFQGVSQHCVTRRLLSSLSQHSSFLIMAKIPGDFTIIIMAAVVLLSIIVVYRVYGRLLVI